LSRQISSSPDLREMDMLLSAGEQVTIALVTLALQSLGLKARSFTGPQVGMRTDHSHTQARITQIDGDRVRRALDAGAIAVVAGFQGLSDEDEITTLGRGGSDLTAVALAAALKADVCEIYTDVDGVYTADPNIVPDARKLARVAYDEMLELASAGGRGALGGRARDRRARDRARRAGRQGVDRRRRDAEPFRCRLDDVRHARARGHQHPDDLDVGDRGLVRHRGQVRRAGRADPARRVRRRERSQPMSSGKAAVFFGPGKPFEIRDVPVPHVQPDAVLIRVSLANVCGSDLHFWRGDAPLRLPEDGWIYGHEMTGRVARLGARVKTDSLGRPIKEGDRVAYTYFYPCGRCYACLANEPAACPAKIERPLGPSQFPHFHGAFAEYYYLRSRGAIFVVPDSL